MTPYHKVWTFVIRGGTEFDLSLPNTPKLEHAGGRTIWQMAGTDEVAAAAEVLIKDMGAVVERFAQTQTPEQTQERQLRLGFME